MCVTKATIVALLAVGISACSVPSKSVGTSVPVASREVAALQQQVTELDREVAALKKELSKQRGEIVADLEQDLISRERERARMVYVQSILPILRPMMKDFGMSDGALPPPEKIETFADAYRPMFDMLRQLGEVAGGK